MTALVINCIIGGGIYMFPGELMRLLGPASPFAMILAAFGMAVIMARGFERPMDAPGGLAASRRYDVSTTPWSADVPPSKPLRFPLSPHRDGQSS